MKCIIAVIVISADRIFPNELSFAWITARRPAYGHRRLSIKDFYFTMLDELLFYN